MKITGLSVQVRDNQRVNVMVDGVYRFSLDINQVAELGLRVGREYAEEELTTLEEESTFGKVYTRTLEYMLMRPHSSKELRDYLYRKTRPRRTRTGAIVPGVSAVVTQRVYDRLMEKGYINDEAFARYWVENRNLRKGISQRKLRSELLSKGVDISVINVVLQGVDRDDRSELLKIIERKSARYPDEQKFIAYLVGKGFSYDDVKNTLASKEV